MAGRRAGRGTQPWQRPGKRIRRALAGVIADTAAQGFQSRDVPTQTQPGTGWIMDVDDDVESAETAVAPPTFNSRFSSM